MFNDGLDVAGLSMPVSEQASVVIRAPVGASVHLLFDTVLLGSGDSLRFYSDERLTQEMPDQTLSQGDGLPLAPIVSPGNVLTVKLGSSGDPAQTAFRATVGCVCTATGELPRQTVTGPTCEPSPCGVAPCQNGGTCVEAGQPAVSADGSGGHRRMQASEVVGSAQTWQPEPKQCRQSAAARPRTAAPVERRIAVTPDAPQSCCRLCMTVQPILRNQVLMPCRRCCRAVRTLLLPAYVYRRLDW